MGSLKLDSGSHFDHVEVDDGYDSSLFECNSIESPSSLSIFSVPLTDKFDLNKILDELEIKHQCIDSTFHYMDKSVHSLLHDTNRDNKLLQSAIESSDVMLAKLSVIKTETKSLMSLLLPEKQEFPTSEAKDIPNYDPIYSSEYVEKYVTLKLASGLALPTPAAYKALFVASIAMLIYAVFIRDQTE